MTRARTTNYPTNPNSNPIIRLHKFKIGLELDSSLRSYNVSITFFLLWFIKHKTNKFNRKIPTQALQIGRRKPTRSLGQKLWIMGYCRSWEGATRSHSVLTTTPTLTQNLLLHQNIMQLRNSLIKHLQMLTLWEWSELVPNWLHTRFHRSISWLC